MTLRAVSAAGGATSGGVFTGGQPDFRATRSTGQSLPVSTSTVILFDTIGFNVGTGYTAASGIFNPKTPGLYLVTCNVAYNGTAVSAGTLQTFLNLNGTVYDGNALVQNLTGAQANTISITSLIRLNGTTDSVTITMNPGTDTTSVGSGSFAGYYIGA